MYLRGYSTDATKLATDRFICSYAINCTSLLLDMQGTGFVKDTHSLPQCITATGFAVPNEYDAVITDIPTVAEFNARSLVSADYTIVADLGTVQTADHTAAIADVPTVAEFEARTLESANYVVAADLSDTVIEGTITIQHAFMILLAALAGKSDGAKTTLQHFRNTSDTKNRITAVVDSSGNRTTITLDLT